MTRRRRRWPGCSTAGRPAPTRPRRPAAGCPARAGSRGRRARAAGGRLVLPAGNASGIFLVRVLQGSRLDLTLPAAANGQSRFVTVRRLDERGRVLVKAAPGEHLEGGREIHEGHSHDSDTLALDGRWDYVTLVSDGTTWFVFAERR